MWHFEINFYLRYDKCRQYLDLFIYSNLRDEKEEKNEFNLHLITRFNKNNKNKSVHQIYFIFFLVLTYPLFLWNGNLHYQCSFYYLCYFIFPLLPSLPPPCPSSFMHSKNTVVTYETVVTTNCVGGRYLEHCGKFCKRVRWVHWRGKNTRGRLLSGRNKQIRQIIFFLFYIFIILFLIAYWVVKNVECLKNK